MTSAILPQRHALDTGRGFPGLEGQAPRRGLGPSMNSQTAEGFDDGSDIGRALRKGNVSPRTIALALQQMAKQKSQLEQQSCGPGGRMSGMCHSNPPPPPDVSNPEDPSGPINDGGPERDPLRQNRLGRPSRIGDDNCMGGSCDAQLEALSEVGGGGGYFEDRVFAIMCKVVEDFQKKIEQRLQKLQSEAKAAEATTAAGGKDTGQESRNIEFEKIKFDMQKLSQMQQAMSNILNTMDELAKSAIRHIKV